MEQLLNLATAALSEKKAIDPVLLNVSRLSDVTDYFLICSGQTPIQVRAIADNLSDRVVAAGIGLPKKEGYQDGRWILMDFGALVVHIMNQSERDFYALEKLWHDAPRLPVDQEMQ